MLAVVEASAILGVDAYGVRVEVNMVSSQIPMFTIVGLPDAAVQESKERVRAAIKNSGLLFPFDKKITVNLAPADTKKAGPAFDLPIAIGILVASGQIAEDNIVDAVFIGELSLDGSVRSVTGVLPVAIWARQNHRRRLIVPAANTREAAIVGDVDVYPVHALSDVLELLANRDHAVPVRENPADVLEQSRNTELDFADVKGQGHVKRALEVAAAGGHNVILVGSPGSGKTMLARRLPTILPSLSVEEALEVTKLYSVAGLLPSGASLITERPFRSPHHTISNAGLTGGGAIPRPGEVSLGHHGVLFLDDLPGGYTHHGAYTSLVKAWEEGHVTVAARGNGVTFPARFQLVAAMAPCPCGNRYEGANSTCRCSNVAIRQYLTQLQGPLLDRMDVQIEVLPPVSHHVTESASASESSAAIKARVQQARQVQSERFAQAGDCGAHKTSTNAHMTPRQVHQFCRPERTALALLDSVMQQMGLAASGYDRILKIARTIADLAGDAEITVPHIAEAVQYRAFDRNVAHL